LSQIKLNVRDFEAKMALYDDQLETIRFACYDTFKVIKQTDNYIEKYLPF
jgi:hypothetical protein